MNINFLGWTTGRRIGRCWRSPMLLSVALGLASVQFGQSAAVLVAHWKFDESGGANALDRAGSFPGILSASGSSFVPGGISGNALSLSRDANGFVNMGNVLGFTSGDFSVVFWVKTTEAVPNRIAFSKHNTGSENGYFIATSDTGGGGAPGKATFVASEFVSQSPTSTTPIKDRKSVV